MEGGTSVRSSLYAWDPFGLRKDTEKAGPTRRGESGRSGYFPLYTPPAKNPNTRGLYARASGSGASSHAIAGTGGDRAHGSGAMREAEGPCRSRANRLLK